jgi:hypothetical protein
VARLVDVVVAAGVVVAATSCVDETPAGTSGVRGNVVFQAPTDLVWSSRLAVGSTFDVSAVARSKKNALASGATVKSSDDDVAVVDAVVVDDGAVSFRVTVKAPGLADLVVADDDNAATEGGEVDHIRLQAARAVTTTLVDAALVGATDAVDPSLPARFGVVDDDTVRVLVAGTDRCGEALLDLGASVVVVAAPEGVDPASLASVAADGPAAFVITPAGTGSLRLQLQTPGLEPLDFDVDVVARSSIDEVRVEAAAADAEAGTVSLWGRAFVDDREIVGQDFSWTASERVTLATPEGPATTATIAFPAADQPADERPATVTAEVVGEEDSVDLFALTDTSLVVAREAPPARPEGATEVDADDESSTGGASCGGGETCDALAALLPGLSLVGLRRRRRGGRR